MKITKPDYDDLRLLLVNTFKDARLGTMQDIIDQKIKSNEMIKDCKKAFLWYCFGQIPNRQKIEWLDRVYKYANDDHIYTALKDFFDHHRVYFQLNYQR